MDWEFWMQTMVRDMAAEGSGTGFRAAAGDLRSILSGGRATAAAAAATMAAMIT